MKYQCALISVKDVRKSLAFYQKWFDMEVEVDLGANICLKGGLSIQENFTGLVGLPPESELHRAHNMELYFDCEDLDEFDRRLKSDPEIEWVHPIREYPWKQRVIRIYDPDHHILEIGESMPIVFQRLIAQGYSLEETAVITEHPLPYVRAVLEGLD